MKEHKCQFHKLHEMMESKESERMEHKEKHNMKEITSKAFGKSDLKW